jgi:hypothetical protein
MILWHFRRPRAAREFVRAAARLYPVRAFVSLSIL